MAGEIKIFASITRKYGKVEATFGAERSLDRSAGESSRTVYAGLVQVINIQFDEFEANELKNQPRGVESEETTVHNAAGEWFTAIDLIKEMKGGNEYYYIRTAEPAFAKHGLSAYPEFLDEYHLREFMGKEWSLAFEKGSKVFAVVGTGGKKKAAKLTRKAQNG